MSKSNAMATSSNQAVALPSKVRNLTAPCFTGFIDAERPAQVH
jgi:hypothetical protein